MSPLPFSKRSYSDSSDCSYYDSSCSSHRLSILIIIICVGILVSGILSFLFVRSRGRRVARERARLQASHPRKSNDPFLGMQDPYLQVPVRRDGNGEDAGAGAPPPYTPRKPERAVVYPAIGNWR